VLGVVGIRESGCTSGVEIQQPPARYRIDLEALRALRSVMFEFQKAHRNGSMQR
jgi:hypothetical protein